MANRYLKDQVRTLEGGPVKLFGHVVTSTSGAIDTSSTSCKGFSVAKTGSETGRYTITLEDNYNALLGVSVAVVGADDTAYTASKGLPWFLRNVDVGDSFDIQFAVQDSADESMDDAELEDGAEFYIEITLKNSSAW